MPCVHTLGLGLLAQAACLCSGGMADAAQPARGTHLQWRITACSLASWVLPRTCSHVMEPRGAGRPCRDESRISTAFLSALNAFLLPHGLDVSSRCAELHSAAHALVLRCWRSSRDPRLREAMTAYLRIQLTLGGITGSHRDDMGRALEGTLQQSGFKWWELHTPSPDRHLCHLYRSGKCCNRCTPRQL